MNKVDWDALALAAQASRGEAMRTGKPVVLCTQKPRREEPLTAEEVEESHRKALEASQILSVRPVV